jgi:1,4-dihydroxy-2-naphthoate octaprenyltransferase
MIALSYGPWMVLGSLYLHTRSLSWAAFAASLVPACFIMALAVVNAIPDFHQDRLGGKRNLVVRAGRENAVYLYLGLAGAGLAVIVMGVIARAFTPWALAALVASCRLSQRAMRLAQFLLTAAVPARHALDGVAYIVVTGLFTLRFSRNRSGERAPHRRSLGAAARDVAAPRDCDLACLHCCTDSAPASASPMSHSRRSPAPVR